MWAKRFDLPFHIPAPRLGPPSAHAGTALVAWAVEARWDIEMGRDERVAAALVDVRQHRDLLQAGVIDVGAGAMHDSWDDEGATLAVRPLPPIDAGTTMEVTITWPGAVAGRSARVELVADIDAARDLQVVCSSVELTIEALRGGARVSSRSPLTRRRPVRRMASGSTIGCEPSSTGPGVRMRPRSGPSSSAEITVYRPG